MQTFTLGDMIQYHHALSLVKKPSSKIKTAIAKLEDEICFIVVNMKRIGPTAE